MSPPAAIVLDPRDREAYDLPAAAGAHSVFVQADGLALIVQPDGTVQPWPVFGRRSAAYHPSSSRGRR